MSSLILNKKSTPVFLAVIIAAIYATSLFVVPLSSSAFSATPLASTAPKVLLRPLNSSPGKSVKVTAIHFTVGTGITATVKFNGATVASGIPVNSSGGFVTTFNVPLATAPGSYQVTATDSKGVTASNTLNVAAALKIIMSTNGKAHIVGVLVSISGTGFGASKTITILFGGTQVATTTSNSTGGFQTTFTVPAMPAGSHQVTVGDGTLSASRPFVIVAHITANPEFSVAPGGMITVTGTGFAASSSVSFTLGTSTLSATTSTDSTGSFSVSVQVPPAMTKGGYTLTATDSASDSAKVRVTVA